MGALILKQGMYVPLNTFTEVRRKFHAEPICFLVFFFGDKKIAFKSSLDLHFHPSISEFRFEEKIHTKAVVDMSRGAGGSVFLFSWKRLGGGQQEPIVSSKTVLEDLNMKFRSKFSHGCQHCAIQSLQGNRYKMFKIRFSRF